MGLLTTSSSKPGDEKSPSTQSDLPAHVQQALARVTEVSSLPEITSRIVQVVENPDASAHDMHEIVKNDPALATKILKVVNSAFYGLPAQIASLDRAIVMLGLSAVKNIALAASMARMFKPGRISDEFSARDLWRHCIAVGVCARMLNGAAGGQQREEAFVAGLVHDLGLLVGYQAFNDEFGQVVEACVASPQDFCALERQLIGADHQQTGLALAKRWKFPQVLRSVISYHHDPEPLQPELRKVVTVIQVADTICCQQEYGFYLTSAAQDLTLDMLDMIGVSEEKLGEIVEALPQQIAEAEQIFSE